MKSWIFVVFTLITISLFFIGGMLIGDSLNEKTIPKKDESNKEKLLKLFGDQKLNPGYAASASDIFSTVASVIQRRRSGGATNLTNRGKVAR
jgi:hypothetical protein